MSIKAEYVVEIGRALSEIIGQICPFLQFFHKSTKISKRFSGVTQPITVFAHNVATFNALLSCPSPFRYSNPFWNGSATKKFSTKNADFPTFGGCHGNVPWAIAKWMKNLSGPYIALPIPEKLVKIRPVVPENSLLRGWPLKIFKKKEKYRKKIYSPPGMQAEWAKNEIWIGRLNSERWQSKVR